MLSRRSLRQILVLLAIAAAVGWWVYAHYFHRITNYSPTGSTIIAFGDSLTYGTRVPKTHCYVSLLEKRFGVDIINAGVDGDTTDTAYARFQQHVLDRDPKVVILFLGGGDILKEVPRSRTRENLDRMITAIHDQGAAVVLIGVGGPLGVASVKDVIKELADHHNTACVPNVIKGILGRPTLMIDQVHPNSAGHKIMAERIGDVMHRRLRSVFPEKPRI